MITATGETKNMNGTQWPIRRLLNISGRGTVTLASAMLPAIVLAANIVGTPDPDVLEGTNEADSIDGLAGADVMMGLPGNDTFVVDQAGDEVLEATGDGTDTVISSVSYTLPIFVENLTLAAEAVRATGNDLDNRLRGNSVRNILDGLAGTDTMIGLGGDDTYVVDEAGDVVTEAANRGIDGVRSPVSYVLPANVENLVLTGTGAVNGTGNELANSLRGNAGNNRLNGLAGDDTLSGGGGNDRLTGGPGNDKLIGGPGLDTFDFDTAPDAATNLDRLVNFSPTDDVMRLIGAAFPGLSTAGTLAAEAFRTGAAAQSAAHRILYDPATGVLRYDEDGTGPVASVRFATLTNAPAVTNADFTVVNPVVTAVNYVDQVQPIFTARCTECHKGVTAPHGLKLDEANSYSNIVNVASEEVPSLKRVKPGDPDNSYLVQKVEGTAAVGGRMPLNRTPLTADQIALIRRWISEGANP
jgi:Ca2+-binding RTX toxin-like protein